MFEGAKMLCLVCHLDDISALLRVWELLCEADSIYRFRSREQVLSGREIKFDLLYRKTESSCADFVVIDERFWGVRLRNT